MGGRCETVRYEFGFGGGRAPENPRPVRFPGAQFPPGCAHVWQVCGVPNGSSRKVSRLN